MSTSTFHLDLCLDCVSMTVFLRCGALLTYDGLPYVRGSLESTGTLKRGTDSEKQAQDGAGVNKNRCRGQKNRIWGKETLPVVKTTGWERLKEQD